MSQMTDQHGLLQHSCNLPLIDHTSHPLWTQACHQAPLHLIPLRKSQLQKLIPPRLEFLEIKFLTTRTPKFTCGAYTQTASYCCHQRKERDSHPNLPLSFRGQEKAAAFSTPIGNQSVPCRVTNRQVPKESFGDNNTNLPHCDF